jgi:hypothetical protein
MAEPVTSFDKYAGKADNGEFTDAGSYAAPNGTPDGERALSPKSLSGAYTEYEVLRLIPVQAWPAAPWFDQPGGGTQYYFGKETSMKRLIDQGYIDVTNRVLR